MVNDLLKAASKFYKLSQDPLAPIRSAIEAALAPYASVASIKTLSLIDNSVKVAVHLELPVGGGSPVNRPMLQTLLSSAVAKVNPALMTTVTIDISSEETLPKAAQLRKNFAKFHKLAECAAGDPLCPDIGDFKGEPINPSKPSPKPAPKPAPKPSPKPDTNKIDDVLPDDIKSALDSSVQGAKGSIRLDLNGKDVTVRYNLNKIKAGNSKIKEIFTNALAPLGYSVVEVYGETNVIPNY